MKPASFTGTTMIDKTIPTIKPNTTPVLFVNWSDESFTGVWDKIETTIDAGESLWTPFWLAEHFAKHLVDREMNKKKIPTDHFTRETYVSKCIGNKKELEAGIKNDDPLGIKLLNNNANSNIDPDNKPSEQPKPRRGRPPKNIAITEPVKEESFEGK